MSVILFLPLMFIDLRDKKVVAGLIYIEDESGQIKDDKSITATAVYIFRP